MKKMVSFLVIKTSIIIYVLPMIVALFLQMIAPSATIEFKYWVQRICFYLSLILWTCHLKKENQITFGIKDSNDYSGKKYMMPALLGGVGWQCFCVFAYYISWFNTSISNGFTEESFAKLYNSIPMLLSTAIIMPIIEEFLFRGAIQELFIRYIGIKWGIILSAGLFAFYHGKGFLFALVIAMFMGYIYFKTQNIIYPIIIHIGNNLTNVILSKLDLIGPDKDMLLIICIGVFLVSFSIIRVWRDKK